MKIRNKLLVILILTGMIPMIAIAWITARITENSLVDSAEERLQVITLMKKSEIENYFIELEKHVIELSDMYRVHQVFSKFESFRKGNNVENSGKFPVYTKGWNDIASNQCKFAGKYVELFGFYDLLFMNEYGQVLYTYALGDNLGENLSTGKLRKSGLGLLWNKIVKNRKIKIEDFKSFEQSKNKYASFIGAPVFDDSEKLIGVIAIQINVENLNNIIQQKVGLGGMGETYLIGVDSDGMTSLRSTRMIREGDIGDKKTDDIIERIFKEDNSYIGTRIDNEGSEEFVNAVHLDINGLNWGLFTTMATSEVYEPVNKMKIFVYSGGIIGIIIIVIISFIFSNAIAKPIKNIASATKEISIGSLDNTITLKRKDEIGILASSYKQLQRNLKSIVSQVEVISSGDYSKDIEPHSDRDQLGIALQNMTRKLRETSIENYKQNKIKTFQNELSEKLRGELNINILAGNTITFLAKNLNAQVGALFIYDEDTKELKRIGSYAYPENEKLNKTIKVGEGLAGQAALEMEMISVSDLPHDYVRISSAIGDSKPWNVIDMPLVHGKKLIGVIELGSLKEFSNDDIEILNIVMENITIGLSTAQSRKKMKELLEKTQLQSEELKTQQELLKASNETLEIRKAELKIANKELEQQAEKLKASRETLKMQQEELKVSNEELEEQTQQLQLTGKRLKEQQDELQAANEELEEKTEYLEQQKAEIMKKNEELKATHIEIEKKSKELELSSKYKSEFLANMSHELRTPLNSMLILSRDLADNKKGNLSENQAESAEIIYNSGTDLLNLINEILDLSKIEAGKMTINIEQADLNDILTNINRNFNAQVSNKGLKLNLVLHEDLPESIRTDQQRMEQIIKNLISNSIKFTKEGSITIDINRPGKDVRFFNSDLKPEKTIGISVIDTGIGIPEEKQSYIFEAFQQADGGTSRKFGGTGLGLSISRELSKLLGGELQLKSKEGEGSTFTLYVPEEISSEITSGEEEVGVSEKKEKSIIGEQMTFAGKESISEMKIVKGNGSSVSKDFQYTVASINDDRDKLEKDDRIILMIEDDQAFARTIYKFCEDRNFKFLHAGDGETGLKMIEQYIPDAVILDIHLPGIDGWKVLETLKENSHTRHIPVHMMSVEDQTIDAFTKGAMGYLTKPVSKNQLDEAFDKMESLYSKKIKNILVVEDDENMRKIIIGLVGENGVNVTTTGEGEKALSELKSKLYDCVILDLGLPDISGFEVLKKIGEMKDIDIPPIIVYTGKDLSREEEYELRKYAKSIIVKGVKSEERLLDETALFLHQVIDELPESKKKMISRLHDKEALFDGKKILVVDDDMRNVFALSKILEDKNMNVSSASNGEKALELLEKNSDIDLILMDIMMPVMDGYETMRRIRSQNEINNIPIIALTAKAMKEDRDKCIEAGANDYLTKPIDIEKLISLMRVWLYN